MNLNLDQLLRYAISGGFGLITLLFSFEIEDKTLPQYVWASFGPVEFSGVALVAGSIIYSAYRAIVFPFLSKLTIAAAGRGWNTRKIDLERMKRLLDAQSPQRFFGEWGSQIHLLNTCGLSGCFFLYAGSYAELPQTTFWCLFLVISIFLLFASLFSNWRGHMLEKLLETPDASNDMQ